MPRKSEEVRLEITIRISKPYSSNRMELTESVALPVRSFLEACQVLARFDDLLAELAREYTQHESGFCACGARHSDTSPCVGKPLPTLFEGIAPWHKKP